MSSKIFFVRIAGSGDKTHARFGDAFLRGFLIPGPVLIFYHYEQGNILFLP